MTTNDTSNHPHVVAYRDGVPIRADYPGGAYVDLTFGRDEYRPSEVINVWDDDKNQPEIPNTLMGIAAALEDWMERQDDENPGWLEQYLENARW